MYIHCAPCINILNYYVFNFKEELNASLMTIIYILLQSVAIRLKAFSVQILLNDIFTWRFLDVFLFVGELTYVLSRGLGEIFHC